MRWGEIGWVDFNLVFLPAARAALRGANPYLDPYFMSPPWTLYLVLPLAPLPDIFASLLWLGMGVAATLASLHYASAHFGIPPGRRRLAITALLALSPFSWAPLLSGQFTPFVLLGVVGVFSWRGVAGPLFLLSLKPHLGVIPALLLLLRSARRKRWGELGRGMAVFGLMATASFLIIPGSTSFLRRIVSPNVFALEPQFMASTPELLERIGLQPPFSAVLYLFIALALLALLWAKPTLAMISLVALLATPYARNYDYGLVLIPALYLLHQRFATPLVGLLLLWPLYRIFVGDLSWTWTDIAVPILLLALLLLEGRRGQPPPG